MIVDGVTERVETNLSALSQLIGEDNVEVMKKRIANLIVNRIESDIKSYDYYLFYPGDFNSSIEESFEKVEKKINKMYADAMLESAQEAINRFKDIAVSNFEGTKGLKLRSCHKCEHRNGNRCEFYDKYYWEAHDSICAEEGFIQFVEKEEK